MAILAEFMAVTSFMPCVVRDSKVIVPESLPDSKVSLRCKDACGTERPNRGRVLP